MLLALKYQIFLSPRNQELSFSPLSCICFRRCRCSTLSGRPRRAFSKTLTWPDRWFFAWLSAVFFCWWVFPSRQKVSPIKVGCCCLATRSFAAYRWLMRSCSSNPRFEMQFLPSFLPFSTERSLAKWRSPTFTASECWDVWRSTVSFH